MNQGHAVAQAAARLAGQIIKTPLVEIDSLSELVGKRVFLKLESMQRTGSFKFRGATNFMLTMPYDATTRGVITGSSGSHGLGMSLAGRMRGLKCTVVMPERTPEIKQRRAQQYGATVVLYGAGFDEAQAHAKALAAEQSLTYVPSFDHPAIIAGQGTILKEIMEELPQTQLVLAPVGGGGLLSGLLVAREEYGYNTEIAGIEPTLAACMSASVEAGGVTTLSHMSTVAEGVAVRTPGALTYALVERLCPRLAQVSDEAILAAQQYLLHEAKLLAETAGAVSVAALLAGAVDSAAETVVCVISGANMDLGYLRNMI